MQEHRLALKPGYVLEHFRIERVLGKGGFGITYLAVDVRLGKRVAIKELLPDTIATRVEGSTVAAHSVSLEEDWHWAKERFMEEAQMLAGFSHPAIVGVHWLSESNGTVYMVMDYVEGESYETRLRRIGTEPDETSLMAVMGPVLDGLEEVHAKGLLHRDIKPDNILIKRNGQPVLIDFGAARESVGKTVTMTSMVTHGYSPIEQYQSKGKMGPWTDIYAVGAVMCRAMTGEKPPMSTDRLMEDEFEWLSHREIAGFNGEFRQAVDWALRVKPPERPKDLREWTPTLGSAGAAEHSSAVHTPRRDEPVLERESRSAQEAALEHAVGDCPPPPLPDSQQVGGLSAGWHLVAMVAGLALLIFLAFVFGSGVEREESASASDIAALSGKDTPREGAGGVGAQSNVINVPGDHATIGSALAAAKAGDTVLVAPGVYEECINLVSGVSVRGAYQATTIIRNRSTQNRPVAAINTSGASISNVTVQQRLGQTTSSRYSAIFIENSTVTVENCAVQSSGHGIVIAGTGNSAVVNCLIEKCNWSGIFVDDNTGRIELRENICANNGEQGISIKQSGRVVAKRNTIRGNGADGIAVITYSEVDLIDNIVSVNKGGGVFFSGGSRGRVEGNTCESNAFSGFAFRGGSTRVYIVGNDARKNGGYGFAIETVCKPLSFENNTATGNAWEPQINRSATWND